MLATPEIIKNVKNNGMKEDLVVFGAYIMAIKGNGNEKWMSAI